MNGARTILRLDAVMKLTGLGRTAIYAAIARGDFAAPVKITAKASGWFEDEVADWQTKLPRGKRTGARSEKTQSKRLHHD